MNEVDSLNDLIHEAHLMKVTEDSTDEDDESRYIPRKRKKIPDDVQQFFLDQASESDN